MKKRAIIMALSKEVSEVHDRFPNWTLDNAFVHWFLKAFLVPDDQIAARCVTGISHDKGVDAIYLDEDNRKAFVLQGKYHQGAKPPPEKREDVTHFARLAQKLWGPEQEFQAYLEGIDPNVEQGLGKVRQRLRRRNYSLNLYYVTTGRCSTRVEADARSETAQSNGRSQLWLLQRSHILVLLDDYIRGAAPPVPYLDLPVDDRGTKGGAVLHKVDKAAGLKSWVISMSGRDVGELYRRAGDRVFARNIRGFLENTEVNGRIEYTLENETENFWYFNNGITIVCDSASSSEDERLDRTILHVRNPQIINGQQTTRTLNKAARNSAASVLVKVIAIPREPGKGHEQYEQLVSQIVAATNWQNAIKASDLRANDARQVSLERELATFGYQYLRKRESKREARRRYKNLFQFQIKKDELAQIIAACEFDPVVVRAGKEGLFDIEEPYYKAIFDGRPARDGLTLYWLGRVVKGLSSGYPDRSYAKWHVLHQTWRLVSGILRPSVAADRFRERCERRDWVRPLHMAINQTYRGILEFYRKNKGRGPRAIDISNFFYRAFPRLHTKFNAHWHSRANKRKRKTTEYIDRLKEELSSGV